MDWAARVVDTYLDQNIYYTSPWFAFAAPIAVIYFSVILAWFFKCSFEIGLLDTFALLAIIYLVEQFVFLLLFFLIGMVLDDKTLGRE